MTLLLVYLAYGFIPMDMAASIVVDLHVDPPPRSINGNNILAAFISVSICTKSCWPSIPGVLATIKFFRLSKYQLNRPTLQCHTTDLHVGRGA